MSAIKRRNGVWATRLGEEVGNVLAPAVVHVAGVMQLAHGRIYERQPRAAGAPARKGNMVGRRPGLRGILATQAPWPSQLLARPQRGKDEEVPARISIFITTSPLTLMLHDELCHYTEGKRLQCLRNLMLRQRDYGPSTRQAQVGFATHPILLCTSFCEATCKRLH